MGRGRFIGIFWCKDSKESQKIWASNKARDHILQPKIGYLLTILLNSSTIKSQEHQPTSFRTIDNWDEQKRTQAMYRFQSERLKLMHANLTLVDPLKIYRLWAQVPFNRI